MFSRRSAFISTCLLLMLSGCALGPREKLPSPVSPHVYYSRGMQKLAEKDLSGAIAEFNKALKVDKNFANAYVGLALVALEQGKCEAALHQVKVAKSKDKRCVEAYIAEGRIFSTCKSRPDWLAKALRNYKIAIKLAPHNDAAYFYLGETYKSVCQLSKAAQSFKLAMAQKGRFFSQANSELKIVQQILKISPQTKLAIQIATKPQITRADLAVLLSTELRIGQLTFRNKYSKINPVDVSDIAGHWAQKWIKEIINLHLMGLEAFPDGTFRPDLPVTRANFALVAQYVAYIFSSDPYLSRKYSTKGPRFPDVKRDEYLYNAIAFCVRKGIMRTKPNGNFCPEEPISGLDALTGISQLKKLLCLQE